MIPAPHLAEPGHTGMTCEAMQVDDAGYGDPCGQPVSDPIHHAVTVEPHVFGLDHC